MCINIGVYKAVKTNGDIYYRASITYKSKHLSLGSFSTAKDAHSCYLEAQNILNSTTNIEDFEHSHLNFLSFEKYVCLINFRDNNIYFKTPIYLLSKYFIYYYSKTISYKFDVDDLFYYSKHKIMKRNGHLFVAEYGMQVNILSRYGIKNFAVAGKDYFFKNGDSTDFRYNNIEIVNHYYGVTRTIINGKYQFTAKIHINGDYIIGRYSTESDAAVAYNKAADYLNSIGIDKNFQTNYIEELSSIEYAAKYNMVRISKKIRSLI